MYTVLTDECMHACMVKFLRYIRISISGFELWTKFLSISLLQPAERISLVKTSTTFRRRNTSPTRTTRQWPFLVSSKAKPRNITTKKLFFSSPFGLGGWKEGNWILLSSLLPGITGAGFAVGVVFVCSHFLMEFAIKSPLGMRKKGAKTFLLRALLITVIEC